MSRIGKKPLVIPGNVKVAMNGRTSRASYRERVLARLFPCGNLASELNELRQRASSPGDAPAEERVARSEERPPRHSIESLDSLSVDIARMIDHDAAAELWDRYKRGERNGFTRKLYTMQGQRAFEEIRR